MCNQIPFTPWFPYFCFLILPYFLHHPYFCPMALLLSITCTQPPTQAPQEKQEKGPPLRVSSRKSGGFSQANFKVPSRDSHVFARSMSSQNTLAPEPRCVNEKEWKSRLWVADLLDDKSPVSQEKI